MAYIRTKKVKGKEYQYLVEGYRDKDGKVKQRTLKYLGAVDKSKADKPMVTAPTKKITFFEYLNYSSDTDKVAEYQATGISEYWIVDPIEQKVTVLVLDKNGYNKTIFTGDDAIISSTFSELKVTAANILLA